MAAPDVSTVVALSNKALDLKMVGHTARELEYRQRALVAAQALGAPDCLIVAQLHLDIANWIQSKLQTIHAADGAQRAALLATAVEHFSAAVATLQRRRAADTLLTGSCTAAEVAWTRRTMQHVHTSRAVQASRSLGGVLGGVVLSEQGLTAFANLVGHTAFLQAASYAVSLIVRIVDRELSVTPQLLRTCWDLLADAANLLVALPHAPGTGFGGPGHEGSFVQKMRSMMDMPTVWVPMDAARARVLKAWRSLERSGIIQQRLIDLKIHVSNVIGDNVASTAAAAAAAPGLRTCGLKSCH
jgi:hypothetical protein